MFQNIYRWFFLKPMTEEQKRWAVLLAVSCERVR